MDTREMAVFTDFTTLAVFVSLLSVALSHPLTLLKEDKVAVSNVICPGGVSQCPTGDTCCKNQNGYGCCPKLNAVCCADMIHCCPHGYICGKTVCEGADSNHPMLELSARPEETVTVEETVENMICPGGTNECPTGNTCCYNGQGGFGCCPHLYGMCCSDMKHCCPYEHSCCADMKYCCPVDTTCGAGDDCERVDSSHPMLELSRRPKEAATAVKSAQEIATYNTVKETIENVICPGGRYECPTGDTCCANGKGGYGCCPKPSAVCCSDMKHCCPNGYTCGASDCHQEDSYHPMLELVCHDDQSGDIL